jgi:NADH-quinone oxidoreductase subunit L
MAGPTPVSALIHAATMVTAGVYMVTRLGFVYLLAPQMMMIIALVGTLTAVVAAAIGFAQTDIKKVLAYSTVSQLGFMFAAAGCGAFTAAIFHLFTHAFFKAGLFLGAGSVMHAMGDRTEIMEMGGLRTKIPATHRTFLIYCLAIAGIFPFAGFFSKDEILLGAYAAHMDKWPHGLNYVIWGLLSLTALGTAFYMWRLYFLVFWGESRADAETQAHIQESPAVMTAPLGVLAVGAVGLGFFGLPHIGGLPNGINSWLDATYRAWGDIRPPIHHVPVGGTLGLMLLSLALGLLGIFVAHHFYAKGPDKVRGLVASMAGLHKVVVNKFYVDELYDLVIVRPFRTVATVAYNAIDRFVIDLVLVNGAAFVTDVFGRLLRFVQNGDVQRYFAATVLGLVAILWWATQPEPVDFTAKGTQAEMRFTADALRGPAFDGSDVTWDFTGDGVEDKRGTEVTWQFDKPGKHKVTLWVTDSVFHDDKKEKSPSVHKITREIEVKP